MKRYMNSCIALGVAVTIAYVWIHKMDRYISGRYANNMQNINVTVEIINKQNSTLSPGINYISTTEKPEGKSSANYKILFLGEIPSWMGDPNEFISRCHYNACSLIGGFNQMKMKESDAVIFYGPVEAKPIVTRGKLGQVWVFLSMESPKIIPGSFFHLNNKLNWTWTYRRDSDIVDMYGEVRKKPKSNDRNIFPKQKPLAWIVSNCASKSNREEYVNMMRRYIHVDTYGKCGNLHCTGGMCSSLLKSSYSFYLSLENSLCRDYITEKVLLKARDNIVPVVRGGGDVSQYMPPNSYIDTRGFKTVRHLVYKLKHLQSNRLAYSEFHKWRQFYTVQFKNLDWCELCRRLHFQEKYKRMYADFQSWWTGNDELGQFCTTASDIG